MSDRLLRHRVPVSRRSKQPQPSPSHRRTTTQSTLKPRRLSKPSKPIKVIKRCNSDPTLATSSSTSAGGDDDRRLTPTESVFFRPQTCTDIFCPKDYLVIQSSPKFEGYKKDAKVVVSVTVEGSSGPVRTMVKLGSSVDEAIRLVVNKYNEEGRSPRLDKDAASGFELHHSYFSLQSLNKSDMIGEAGSRSFYLRKSSSNSSSNMGGERECFSFSSDNISVCNNTSPLVFLPGFISRRIDKIVRRTRKFWKIMGCMP